MRDTRAILTPFFIDQPDSNLKGYLRPDWTLNEPVLSPADPQTTASAIHRPLADFVQQALDAGQCPLSIAGDCCASLPVVAGIQRTGIQPTLLWLDAHGDFNTWDSTPSGFLGGMPLAMIAGLGDLGMAEAVGLRPLESERIILADGRDLDPGEQDLLQKSQVRHLKRLEDIFSLDLSGPVHLHFDTDVVNLIDLPAVKYPAPGGPSADKVSEVLHYLCDKVNLVAISITIGTWDKQHPQVVRSDKMARDLLEILLY